jgi:hypothetical protein
VIRAIAAGNHDAECTQNRGYLLAARSLAAWRASATDCGLSSAASDDAPGMVPGTEVELELVDVGVEVDVVLDVVVVSDVTVVVVLDVVVDGGDVVVVVGSDGGGGKGGRSKPPRSGNPSWEQSRGSPVRPSTKSQYSS